MENMKCNLISQLQTQLNISLLEGEPSSRFLNILVRLKIYKEERKRSNNSKNLQKIPKRFKVERKRSNNLLKLQTRPPFRLERRKLIRS